MNKKKRGQPKSKKVKVVPKDISNKTVLIMLIAVISISVLSLALFTYSISGTQPDTTISESNSGQYKVTNPTRNNQNPVEKVATVGLTVVDPPK